MINLTPREKDVVELVIRGKTNNEIGDILFISFHTVKAILENVYKKFNCKNRVLLAIKIMREFPEFFEEENASN